MRLGPILRSYELITHIIYHIDGRKVGCTNNLKARRIGYKAAEGCIPEIEILEELHDKTDQEAGDIEWAWADKLGYRRGVHYTISRYTNKVSTSSNKKKGFATFSDEKLKRINQNNIDNKRNGFLMPEVQLKAARLGGLKGGVESFLNKTGIHSYSIEDRRQIGRSGGEKSSALRLGGMYQHTTCPHCGLEGQVACLKRWHFDNCKQRK